MRVLTYDEMAVMRTTPVRTAGPGTLTAARSPKGTVNLIEVVGGLDCICNGRVLGGTHGIEFILSDGRVAYLNDGPQKFGAGPVHPPPEFTLRRKR